MGAVDHRGKPIDVGSFVRYSGTGVAGKVLDVVEYEDLKDFEPNSKMVLNNQDNFWVKVDKTDLWYLSNSLEIISESDVKKSRFDDLNLDKDVEETVKDIKDEFNDIELTSAGGEGGG